MSKRPLEVARACLQAYVDKDRASLEALLSADFHFTSPLDNALDRGTYLEVCWPNSAQLSDFKTIHEVEDGERAFIVYEAHTASGKCFRNSEVYTVRGGKLIATEVYFGWDVRTPPAGARTRRREDMSSKHEPRPKVVSKDEWLAAHRALLAKEKKLTHARDELVAKRRRLPMMRVQKPYSFEGPRGKLDMVELFEGHRQLLLYHFMFAPDVDGWPSEGCPGCSLFTDNIGQFTPQHLNARGVALALVSRAPVANIEAYRRRMGWPHLWVSTGDSTFNADFGLTTPEGEFHGLSVFLRDDGEVFRTYFTSARGSEGLGNVWGFLDATPYGRQETWEDSPAGRPQGPPYEWWKRHDEYPQ